MPDIQMGVNEKKFAEIIWQNEPISTVELARLAQQTLGWKKTTSYTVLKRLCNKGIFQTENSTVTSLISQKEFYSIQSENFVEDTFGGSLPAFLAAFTARKQLSSDEIQALRRMVDEFQED